MKIAIVGTIGNESEIKYRRVETTSYHVTEDGEEIAIRYDRQSATDAAVSVLMRNPGADCQVIAKPILQERP